MPTHMLLAFLTGVCYGEGWQSVHHATEKWYSTCGPCARCRFSLGAVKCHDPSHSWSFDTEPDFYTFLGVLGMAGVK